MKRFQVVEGMYIPPGNRPVIMRSDVDVAMGGVPGWNTLFDPAYVRPGGVGTVNRAKAMSIAPPAGGSSHQTVGVGEFPNGEAAFEAQGDDDTPSMVGTADINPTAFTVFWVARASGSMSASAPQNVIANLASAATASDIGPYITYNAAATNLNWFEVNHSGQSVYRLRAVGIGISETDPELVMCTFSTEQGCRIWRNGVLIESEPDDKRPLTAGFRAGEYTMLRNSRGQRGMVGILDIDLSAPEHGEHRLAIERFLMNKYGIS